MNKAVLFLFLLLSTWVNAQVYSLTDLLKMADTANLTLKNARLDVTSNINQRKAFLASQYPKITANGDYRYNAIIPGQIIPADFFGGPPGTFAEVKFGVPINLSNTVQLTQFIFNPQLNYGLNALAINAQIVEIQEKMAFQEVHYQVSNTFFGLQAINQQLAYLQKNEKNMNELIRNMELMQQQGLIIPTEVDKLKINRNSITNGIIKLENTRLQLNQLLSILVGFPEGTTLTIASDEIISNPTITAQTNALRPELELIQLQKQMNIEERKGTYMAYLPTLSFYGAYNYNYNMKPEDDFRTGIPSAFLGLRLDWTLFDGFEKKNKLKVNAYNKEKIQNQELLATQQLNLASANAKREAELQTANLEMNKEQLRLSERVYDAAKSQFKAGTISTNELLQADNGLQQAQSSLVGAYLSLRQAELSYLKSISQLK
jgi:outer membrane protein TolC